MAVATLAMPAMAQSVPACAAPALQHFQTAAKNWGAGRREAATVWLYVAQLRSRACLKAFPNQPQDGAPALFASLMETIGRPINEYAFGDIPQLVRSMNEALKRDAADPERTVPAGIRRQTRRAWKRFATIRRKVRMRSAGSARVTGCRTGHSGLKALLFVGRRPLFHPHRNAPPVISG